MSKSFVSLRSLSAIIACTSLSAVAGYAQQAATDQTTVKLEKYIVTGSNIPTTEVAGEAKTFPVTVIDRKAIDASGVFNTTELLQKMTLATLKGMNFNLGDVAAAFRLKTADPLAGRKRPVQPPRHLRALVTEAPSRSITRRIALLSRAAA